MRRRWRCISCGSGKTTLPQWILNLPVTVASQQQFCSLWRWQRDMLGSIGWGCPVWQDLCSALWPWATSSLDLYSMLLLFGCTLGMAAHRMTETKCKEISFFCLMLNTSCLDIQPPTMSQEVSWKIYRTENSVWVPFLFLLLWSAVQEVCVFLPESLANGFFWETSEAKFQKMSCIVGSIE